MAPTSLSATAISVSAWCRSDCPHAGDPGVHVDARSAIHRLVFLWKLAKEEITRLDEAEPEATDVVGLILDELEQLDPEATGFRYPENSRGEPNLASPPELLDLDNFNEVLSGVHSFLECANGEIGRRLEWKYESEAEEARSYSRD